MWALVSARAWASVEVLGSASELGTQAAAVAAAVEEAEKGEVAEVAGEAAPDRRSRTP